MASVVFSSLPVASFQTPRKVKTSYKRKLVEIKIVVEMIERIVVRVIIEFLVILRVVDFLYDIQQLIHMFDFSSRDTVAHEAVEVTNGHCRVG